METNIRQILQQWEDEKISQNPGITPDRIIAAGKVIEFKFPAEFKELYTQVNGFTDYDWRENMFSVWSLERIVQEYFDSVDKNFVAFADYLIHSHQIGFVKDRSGIFKMNHVAEYFPLSDSFTGAITLINADSRLIYL